MATNDLKIKSVIGFTGKIVNGLKYTPCGQYLVYPLGAFIILKNIRTDKEVFLEGHSQEISCLTISHDGTKIASGQVNIIGVKADVIVWNLTEAKRLLETAKEVMIGERCIIHRLKQHLTKVQDVAFSCRDDYLATLGGQDDNAIVIWRVQTGESLCGSPAAPDSGLCLTWLRGRNDRLVSAGNYHVRVWQADFGIAPKIHVMDARLGTVRRNITCIAISPDDQFAYCGTFTGDVIKIKIDRDEIKSYNDPDTIIPSLAGVSKDRMSKGVKSIACFLNPLTGKPSVIVGAGDGGLTYMNTQLQLVAGYSTMLLGGVTSIACHPDLTSFTVGTDQCNRYELSRDLQTATLKASCHYGSVNTVDFPEGCPDICVTSSKGDIRLWNVKNRQELLRIQVPNLECLSCLVAPSGNAILSGWDDGKIRAFLPETGKMKFVIPDAHTDKVTALAIVDSNKNPWRLISGGAEGRVRVWSCTNLHQVMTVSLKEHRGPVNCIKVNKDNTQAITASSDGCCIVWDLERYVRIAAFFEPNVFEAVLYHPDESQMLTCGSNHKITYWDSVDSQPIRVIEGGERGMTSLDIDSTGEFFVSGSEDRLVKVWHYDDGLPVAVGKGHSGKVKYIKFSPDFKFIVSVGSAGEIIFWDLPRLEQLRENAGHK
jgi:WD40 repeat protein